MRCGRTPRGSEPEAGGSGSLPPPTIRPAPGASKGLETSAAERGHSNASVCPPALQASPAAAGGPPLGCQVRRRRRLGAVSCRVDGAWGTIVNRTVRVQTRCAAEEFSGSVCGRKEVRPMAARRRCHFGRQVCAWSDADLSPVAGGADAALQWRLLFSSRRCPEHASRRAARVSTRRAAEPVTGSVCRRKAVRLMADRGRL